MGFFKKWFTKDFATKDDLNSVQKTVTTLMEVQEQFKQVFESLGDRLHYSTRLMSERLDKLELNRDNSKEHIKKLREYAISAGQDKPKVTLEGVRLLKEKIAAEEELHKKVHNTLSLTSPSVELWKTTDAIIDILNNSKKDLHYRKIYTIIKSYNLSQADLSLESLKSAMYNLKMSRKIEYGKEAGTFRKKRSI